MSRKATPSSLYLSVPLTTHLSHSNCQSLISPSPARHLSVAVSPSRRCRLTILSSQPKPKPLTPEFKSSPSRHWKFLVEFCLIGNQETISDRSNNSIPPIIRHTPLQIIHIIGHFLRIWSVYSMYRYLSQTGASVVLFIFSCLVPSSIIFLALQKPWKGRPLSNTQVVPSIINGAITALYFILWGKGLRTCGPVRAILAEYSGAILGVLSAVLYGRRGNVWKKVGGLIAMLASFYFLSQGWAMASHSPISLKESLDSEIQTEEMIGLTEMAVPIIAGILSTLRRVLTRRVSLKNNLKRRLHAITISSATCFLFPVAMWDMIIGSASDSSINLPFFTWAHLSTILFGVILMFYVDSIAEERNHVFWTYLSWTRRDFT